LKFCCQFKECKFKRYRIEKRRRRRRRRRNGLGVPVKRSHGLKRV
jgi:hypothetical protein